MRVGSNSTIRGNVDNRAQVSGLLDGALATSLSFDLLMASPPMAGVAVI